MYNLRSALRLLAHVFLAATMLVVIAVVALGIAWFVEWARETKTYANGTLDVLSAVAEVILLLDLAGLVVLVALGLLGMLNSFRVLYRQAGRPCKLARMK